MAVILSAEVQQRVILVPDSETTLVWPQLDDDGRRSGVLWTLSLRSDSRGYVTLAPAPSREVIDHA